MFHSPFGAISLCSVVFMCLAHTLFLLSCEFLREGSEAQLSGWPFGRLFPIYCKALCVSQFFATTTQHLRQLASTEEDLFWFTVMKILLQDPVASLLWAFGEGRA